MYQSYRTDIYFAISCRHSYEDYSDSVLEMQDVTHLLCAVSLIHGNRCTLIADSGGVNATNTQPFALTINNTCVVVQTYLVLQIYIPQWNHPEV